MDTQELIPLGKLLVTLLGAVASIYKLRSSRFGRRAQLKADIEILRLLDPIVSASSHSLVRTRVEDAIKRLYVIPISGTKRGFVHSWVDFITGLILLPAFGLWTWRLVDERFSPWAIATGLMAFIGVGFILNGLDVPSKKVEPKV